MKNNSFDKHIRLVEFVNAELQRRMPAFSKELASSFYNLLLENIRTNKFGFSLSEATLLIRNRLGYASTTPLMESGEFINSIVLEGNQVKVSGVTHSRRDFNVASKTLSMQQLSLILEYGRKDKSIPGFPVWRKTKEEFNKIRRQKSRELYMEVVSQCEKLI